MQCYNTFDGAFNDFLGWGWTVRATWSTVNATETVAGKIELNTTAESKTWNNTWWSGATTVNKPSDIAANDQSDTFKYAEDAEASDTYVISLTPALTAYTTGQNIRFNANTINTGACTINVDGLWAKSIKTKIGTDPVDWEIQASTTYDLVYDGTNFVLQKDVIRAKVLQDTQWEASWSAILAHWLWVAPKTVHITATNANWWSSVWYFDWTDNMSSFITATLAGNSATDSLQSFKWVAWQWLTWIISVDETNVTITYTWAAGQTIWTTYVTLNVFA